MLWIENFQDQKKKAIERWEIHKKEGKVDEDVISLVEKINSNPNHFTTSSCAGRISLLKIPNPGKKEEAEFINKWHRKIDSNKIMKTIKNTNYEGNKWILFDPPIFHIGSRTLEDAYKMTQLGIKTGFKNSGIRSITNKKIITQIISTERLNVLYSSDLTPNYLKNVTKNINFLLDRSRDKLEQFEKSIEKLKK